MNIVNDENGCSLEEERCLVLAKKCKVTLTVKFQNAGWNCLKIYVGTYREVDFHWCSTIRREFVLQGECLTFMWILDRILQQVMQTQFSQTFR